MICKLLNSTGLMISAEGRVTPCILINSDSHKLSRATAYFLRCYDTIPDLESQRPLLYGDFRLSDNWVIIRLNEGQQRFAVKY